jgi:hypothetical protein
VIVAWTATGQTRPRAGGGSAPLDPGRDESLAAHPVDPLLRGCSWPGPSVAGPGGSITAQPSGPPPPPPGQFPLAEEVGAGAPADVERRPAAANGPVGEPTPTAATDSPSASITAPGRPPAPTAWVWLHEELSTFAPGQRTQNITRILPPRASTPRPTLSYRPKPQPPVDLHEPDTPRPAALDWPRLQVREVAANLR